MKTTTNLYRPLAGDMTIDNLHGAFHYVKAVDVSSLLVWSNIHAEHFPVKLVIKYSVKRQHTPRSLP